MPLDLGHGAARLVPALRLTAEAGARAPRLARRPSDWPLQQMSDLFLQDLVCRQPDRAAGALGFEERANLRIGKSRVASEMQMLHNAPATRNHRPRQRAPAIGTMDVARPQCASLDIAELVEHKQRMMAGAGEMPVAGAAFRLAAEPAPWAFSPRT